MTDENNSLKHKIRKFEVDGLLVELFRNPGGRPWTTYSVIAVCVAIWAYLNLSQESSLYERITELLIPSSIALWSGAYWGLLTSAFVHFDIWHIFFNMWWLKDFGAFLEPTMGRLKYLMFIITGAIVSSGAQLAFSNQTGIGFSGVVYAMFGYALAARHVVPSYQRIVTKQTIVWLSGWLLLCIALTATHVWNVANAAHGAGLLSGYCIGNVFTAKVHVRPSRIGLAFLVLVATLSAVYMPWSQTWKLRDAKAHFIRGVNHHRNAQYDEAISDYTKALGVNPNYSEAYANRGHAYMARGQYDEAISDAGRALELNPRDDKAYYNRGRAYMNKSQYDLALSDFTKALEINPSDVDAYRNRGFIYLSKGLYDQAISDYTNVLEIIPGDAGAYNSRGGAYGNKNEYEEAISDFTKALEIDPKYANAYYNRARAYDSKGEYNRAIFDYSKLIELKPRDAEPYNSLAWLLATAKTSSLRDGKKALELSLKACEISEWKNMNYQDTLAAAYARVGDFANAIRWQEKALESPEFTKDKEAHQRLTLYRNHKAWPPD